MSENEEIEAGDDSGKGLRAQLEQALKVAKEAEARAAAATKALNERQLADVLSAKKISPKAARFIVADGVDPSDTEAVDKWLTDNAELFGAAGNPDESTVPQEERDAFAAMQQSGLQQPAFRGKVDELLAKAKELSDKGDVAALDRLYAESGL
jgi:hypothetical protein